MASESISFDVWANDRASETFKRIGAQATDAAGNVRGLGDRLDKLGSRAVTARVGLDGNKEANAQLDAIDVKLIRLGKRAANPNINLEGQARVLAEISAVDVALDKLGRKTASPDVSDRSLLSRLTGGVGGAGGGLGSLANPASGSIGPVLGNPYVLAGGAAAALGTLPFVAQAASGGIVAALGGGLAAVAVIGAAKSKEVKASFADLTKSANYDLTQIGKPFRPVLVSVLNTAETVLAELEPVFKGAAKIIAGPFKDFANSLAKSFAQPAVKTSITAVATAFGGILKALAPQLPGDIADIATGITRIANTIKDNPRSFADFISFLFKAAGFGLSMIAALSATANYIEKHFLPALHDVAVIFDGVRHEIAHVWDQIFENTIGTVIRLGHNVATQFNSIRHEIAVIFDGARHDIAHIWDVIWNNTVTRVEHGISDVIGWFKGLPGRALGALSGLGHQLWQYGSFVLGQFWAGLKSIWNTVAGWFTGLPKRILKAMGFGSPPGWAIQAGKDVMHGLLIGIGLTQGKVLNTAGKIGNQLGGAFGNTGAQSGSAAVAQSFAASILPRGWSFPALLSLWNQESGWNAYAVNPSSGAAGIPQALGHGNVFALGDYKAQIEWGLSYIAQRYGNSQNAWAHEQRFNWYDQGGWLPPGLSLAVNRTGRPERILSPRESAGGGTVNINVSVPPTVNPRDAGRQVAQLILAHTKSGGMLYPAGATPR